MSSITIATGIFSYVKDAALCLGRTAMEEHLRRRHDRPMRKPGPQGNGAKGGVEGLIRAGLVKGPTTRQTLFRNHRSSYFAVNCPRNKEGLSLPSPLLDISRHTTSIAMASYYWVTPLLGAPSREAVGSCNPYVPLWFEWIIWLRRLGQSRWPAPRYSSIPRPRYCPGAKLT